jgi:RNA polymerase sigma-70 factor (ECF subfamily)
MGHGDATERPTAVFNGAMQVTYSPRAEPTLDDAELVKRLANDLDGTFETLVRCHADRLFTIALRLTGDPRDAEEVAQDVFVRAYHAIGTYDAERVRGLRLRPWLATIAVNLARNRRRRMSDRRPPDALADIVGGIDEPRAPDRSGPEAKLTARVERDRWARLLGELPSRYRLPIVLRHVDDLSYAEMAEALGRPEGTLKAQVHRGLALLRAAWEAAEREEAIA